MSTLEELRKKRIQEIQSRSESGSSLEDAREKRVQELQSERKTFDSAPRPSVLDNTIDTDPENSSLEAFGRSAAVNTLPMAGGLAAGLQGAAIGSAAGPVGTVAGFIGGGIIGSIVTKVAQDKALEVVAGEEWKRNLDQSIAEDRQNNPFATLAGEAAPSLIAFRPSPSTLKQAFNFSKRALSDPKSLSKHIKTLEGKTEMDALMNVGIGAGVDISMETYQQAREGDFNALRLIASGVIGGTLSDPNRLGLKLGFKPTGDAVIEEYTKFGSKTEAADIITQGKIPMLNRGVGSVLSDRMELASILRGEREQSRFDNPRIVEAERISGTIPKGVTADSDINVYRLDGRSGALRVGERVTANPFIADVYGGRINPETTMKAGDMVRTSKGDYVYAPKSEIQARPKLPPVSTNVDKAVRTQVKNREGLQDKARQNKGKEAMRIKEEPARLAKEAKAKADAQQKAADELVAKQEAAAVKQAADLDTKVKTIQAEGKSKVAAETARVAKEKVRISKEIAAVTKKLREDLDAAKLDNVKRKATKTTPLQKAKEQIRFKNLNARIRAKAIADKKKLNEKVTDNTKEIERQTRKEVIDAKKQGKAEKDAQAVKDQSEIATLAQKAVTKQTTVKQTTAEKAVTKQTTVKQTTAEKVETKKQSITTETKTTLIGTKRVKSDSIIKNAVQEARDTSNKAQELDQDVTFQQGTTFVEQRKLSAELLAERGFDDALLFARQATDVELNKLGIARSALYEVLYKTVIKEGQFDKFRDKLESLSLLVADEVSEAAQKSSIHRLATQNDPFRRVAGLKKSILEREKKVSGSVFTKEVDELYAKIKDAGTEEDINKIINDNLC